MLAGTCWRGANLNLIGALLKVHTKSKGCKRVLQTAKGKVKGAFIFKQRQGGKGALLGVHSSRSLIALLERS